MRAGRMASWRSHGWGPMGYTRARTAKENSNPRNYNPQAGYQLVAIQGAVGVLARGVASSKLAIQEKKGGIWRQYTLTWQGGLTLTNDQTPTSRATRCYTILLLVCS